jgi:hypothetical protein
MSLRIWLARSHLFLPTSLLLRGEALDVVLVEGGGHRFDRFQERANLLQLVALQHLRRLRGVVEIAAEDVPAGEDEVVERGQRDEVADQRRVGVGALPQTDRPHLRDGANGLCEAAADRFDSGDERSGDGPHAGDHDAEFSCCGRDAGRRLSLGVRRCGNGC